MVWNCYSDVFYISVSTDTDVIPTKRGVISDIAKTFDVLGWISPTIVLMKIMFQHLWELRLDWDEEIPQLQSEYRLWKSQLQLFESKPFSRCHYRKDATSTTTQLHGFSDASENAYSQLLI